MSRQDRPPNGRAKMAANPFTRGTAPGRARPRHRGSFERGHVKHGGRQKGTPNAISARARNAIAAAAMHVLRGTGRKRNHWQWLTEKNPLINAARERQGLFTLAGPPRVRSRAFSEKAFNEDLSAVAMTAIQTDQFVDKDLVECLTLLFMRDSTAFARFLSIPAPKRSYLAARPHPEMNPGARRVRPIPEWTLGYEPKGNSYTPVPVNPALTPEQAHHEIAGSPRDPKPGWAWLFDSAAKRFFAIDLRPRSPIDEWTRRLDPKLGMIPVPVDPRLTVQDASHRDYGSPLDPAPGFKWLFNSKTERYLPAIADEPGHPCDPKSWSAKLRYRWHQDAGHYSLVHGDAGEDTLYEYDLERCLFKAHQPSLEPGPQTPWRRRFHLRRPDGSYTDLVYDYDPTTNQLVRVTK